MSANEELYRRIVKAVPEGIWVVSPDGRTIFCNERMAELLGTDVEALQRLSCFDPVFPDDLEEAQRQFGLQMASGGQPFDFRLRRIDGAAVWVNISCMPMYDDGGICTGLLGLFTDITERRRAEKSLRASEERFRAIFTQAAVGIAQTSLTGDWLLVNDRLCQILGYTPAELRTKSFLDITHPDDRDGSLAAIRQLLSGEISSWLTEKRYIRKYGTIIWGRLFVSLVRDQTNQPQYFVAVVEEVTDKIQAERALQESQEQLRLALSTGLGIWECDLRNKAVTLSPQYGKVFGHPPLSYSEWMKLIHPDDRERVWAVARENLRQARGWEAEFRVLWPDGTAHWMLSKASVILDEDRQPERMVGVSLDITDRKKAEAALGESEERFRRVFEEGPLGLALIGNDYKFRKVNGALCRMLGYSEAELLELSFPDITHPDDLTRNVELAGKLFNGEVPLYQLQKRYVKKTGEIIWIKLTASVIHDQKGEPLHGLGMIEDVTEVKRSQEEAFARQKLESLGVLAGGIAHDFNNLLGGILAEAELAETDLAAGLTPSEEIQRIKLVAIRGAEIVRELMIFAGQDQTTLVELVDVSRLVEEILELLRISISKRAVLRTDLSHNLPAVRGNAAQIRQVVMNLVINASEAIGDKGGIINVSTAQVSDSVNLASSATSLPPGDCVRLEVSDNGCGMTETVQAKIFDPFFSTKFAGRGLGLAVVRGIVRAHGGEINLRSAPEEGTTFQVFLPCTLESVAKAGGAVTSAGMERSRARVATLLIVEDEETLRLAVSKALRRRGFSVIEASNGSEAMVVLGTHKDEIDGVLLDVTIPGTSSREIFYKIQEMRPDLKVIVTSAYSKESVDTFFTGLRIDHFIRKPFQLGDLVRLLQDTLSAEGSLGRGHP
jgi:PAS domain S-box-containing protein